MSELSFFWLLILSIENGVLRSASLYFVLKNDLFIVTNDRDLAVNSPNGYGKNAISKKEAKRARKNGIMYGHADLGKAIESLPKDLFSDQENELIDVIRGKSGTMEVKSTATTTENTDVSFTYSFDHETDNYGTYILDLINSLYVISK